MAGKADSSESKPAQYTVAATTSAKNGKKDGCREMSNVLTIPFALQSPNSAYTLCA